MAKTTIFVLEDKKILKVLSKQHNTLSRFGKSKPKPESPCLNIYIYILLRGYGFRH